MHGVLAYVHLLSPVAVGITTRHVVIYSNAIRLQLRDRLLEVGV